MKRMDKRKWERIEVPKELYPHNPDKPQKIEVNLESESNFYTGFLDNISSGGIFVATHVPEQEGTEVPITFTLPNFSKPIIAKAKVCWSREYNPIYPETNPGMGMQFMDLTPEIASAINDFMATIRHPDFMPSEGE